MTYVVLNGADVLNGTQDEGRMWFFESLVHEITCAFNHRYLSDIRLPTWFAQGIAHFMAAELVPGGRADKYWKRAGRYVRQKNIDVAANFEKFQGGDHFYIVQSIVRFMAKENKKRFITFYTLLKEGKDQEAALWEAYGLDFDDLVHKWKAASR